jgi:putative glutamine amidotransferase
MGARVSATPPGDAPLIGVTTSEVRRKDAIKPTPQGEPAQTELALGLDYVRAIEAAGGLPVVLPALAPAAVAPLLECLSGICLSGGPDLEPGSYGGGSHPQLGPTEPDVDRFELAAARLAWERDLPLLAICRGAQTLNVSRGGTLVQHLPERPGVRLQHRQTAPAARTTHAVKVEPGSLLNEVLGKRSVRVNSFHHQGVARTGRGLRVSARAPDGVVEAVEAPGRRFVLGLQWHAECLAHRADQAALFSGLVDAAGAFAQDRDVRRAA